MDSTLPIQGLNDEKLSEGEEGNLDSIIESHLDRISSLPEEIIYHILSLLPIEDTVITSALAKRWRHLWLSLPDLVIDLHNRRRWSPNARTNVTNFVDRLLLTLRAHSSIHRFRLSCDGRIDCTRFYSWVCAVMSCNVRELNLEFFTRYNNDRPLVPMPELGELPRSLFTSKTLVLLKIHGRFMFNVPDNVHLPNLKTLHLRSLIYLDDASLQRLFSGCPVLEDLEIIRDSWDYAWTFDVSVPSLKRFTLKIGRNKMKEYLHTGCECKIMVNAPNIEYLEISDFGSDRILISGLPSLVEAHVSIFMLFGYWTKREKEYGNDAYGLLRSLSNVKRLSLTASTLQSLHYANHAHLPTFCNLVHLELGLDKQNGLLPLPYLLESSPKLEVLVFREGITLPGGVTYNCRVRDYKYHWIPPQEIPKCLICCLKAIVVHQFCGVEEEMNLLKYLLKNAMVLEKMIIFCHRGYSVNFGEELSNYAKCASNCKFILHIPKCQGKKKRMLRIVPSSCAFYA